MQNEECPFDSLFDVIGKKWVMLTVAIIGKNPERGFNTIKERVGKITPRALSSILSSLLEWGFVRKEKINGIPPRSRYALTDKGHRLLTAVTPLIEWIVEETYHEGCPIIKEIESS